MDDEFISVHNIEANKINSEPEGLIDVYQIQGITDTDKGYIMKVGKLENPHDILIREFPLLNRFKCFMISRLYIEKELKETKGRYQMIKITICNKNDTSNTPLAYLCFNFQTDKYEISTHDNKKSIIGKYTITLHFMKDKNAKYIQLYESYKFIGTEKMMIILTEYLFEEKVIKLLNKVY